ncbi:MULTISPECIES: hypothetical protein [unclassified Streptomyces]|nr:MULTISPECIES: hypothetical protein [unclassified Streptomyces]
MTVPAEGPRVLVAHGDHLGPSSVVWVGSGIAPRLRLRLDSGYLAALCA